jgi:hypothetical protein
MTTALALYSTTGRGFGLTGVVGYPRPVVRDGRL